MKVVAAYMLAVLGKSIHPSIDEIKVILGSESLKLEIFQTGSMLRMKQEKKCFLKELSNYNLGWGRIIPAI